MESSYHRESKKIDGAPGEGDALRRQTVTPKRTNAHVPRPGRRARSLAGSDWDSSSAIQRGQSYVEHYFSPNAVVSGDRVGVAHCDTRYGGADCAGHRLC